MSGSSHKKMCLWKPRRIVGWLLGTLVLPAILPASALAYPRPGITERISVASDGTEANSFSSTWYSGISADGRYVAFEDAASNLVPGDTNEAPDVFVKDRTTGITERVSLASDGSESNSSSFYPIISGEGRHVVFMSNASNLVPGDTNGFADVFVHDRVTGATERVSVASDGTEGNASTVYDSAISADGRYVAFGSFASNLVPGDTNGSWDVFLHDRVTGTTEAVARAMDGGTANASTVIPAMSGDGRYVAFQSTASNLVLGETNIYFDIFVLDRDTGVTERISIASDGTPGNDASYDPAISVDGRYVAFQSLASNLVPGDTNGVRDIFVHDRTTGTTERVSLPSDGSEANNASYGTAISADGRHIAFESNASNLVPGDTNGGNGGADIFVHDRVAGTTDRVSVASDGAEANSYSFAPAMSADGRYVVFPSNASNLVPGDTNGTYDVFVHDRGTPLGVVGAPSVTQTAGAVGISGRARLMGAVVAEATDPGDDATGIALGAADPGTELTAASLIYRPEHEDLRARLDLLSLPGDPAGAGLPAVVYGMDLRVDGTRYELRAVRMGATGDPSGEPYVVLYRCAPDCVEHAVLTGSFGISGEQVVVFIPLLVIDAIEGTELADVRAYTAAGGAQPGAAATVDEVALPSSVIPISHVELAIADALEPEDEVSFTEDADLAAGDFSGSVSTAGLPQGSYRVWARACLGDACGPAAFAPMTVGAPTEQQDTHLELTVEGRGNNIMLRARLSVLDSPTEGIADKTIAFYSDGELIGTDETDSSGVATLAIPPTHRGANRDHSAVFAGDDFYNASSAERLGRGGGPQ